MNANDYLNEVTARADAATDGPWEMYDANEGMLEYRPLWCVGNEELHNPSGDEDSDWIAVEIHVGDKPDAEFIAATRDDVPRMADALRAVLDLCSEMHAAHERDPAQDAVAYEIESAITEKLGVDS